MDIQETASLLLKDYNPSGNFLGLLTILPKTPQPNTCFLFYAEKYPLYIVAVVVEETTVHILNPIRGLFYLNIERKLQDWAKDTGCKHETNREGHTLDAYQVPLISLYYIYHFCKNGLTPPSINMNYTHGNIIYFIDYILPESCREKAKQHFPVPLID